MTQLMKAVLLSAVVFPGAGHFYLKKIISSVLLAGIASVASYLIISNLFNKIFDHFEKILQGEISPDILIFFEMIFTQSENPELQLSSAVWSVLVVCWLVGIADSYRIARKLTV